MSYKTYSFFSSPLVTLITVVTGSAVALPSRFGWPWWAAVIVGVLSFLIVFIPILNLFHALIFAGYLIADIFFVCNVSDYYTFAMVMLLIFHMIRYGSCYWLVFNDPERSKLFEMVDRGMVDKEDVEGL